MEKLPELPLHATVQETEVLYRHQEIPQTLPAIAPGKKLVAVIEDGNGQKAFDVTKLEHYEALIKEVSTPGSKSIMHIRVSSQRQSYRHYYSR